MSLSQLQEVPIAKTVLLVGPPGAGKSTFCHQTVLHNLAVDRAVIFVTTEYGTHEAEALLKERGLITTSNDLLKFVDGYNQTVGLPVTDRPDTLNASSGNLTSIGIAIAKHQRNIGRKGILLVFDSLTSPYLLCGSDIVRFLRLSLSRFAGDGNSVLACFDEGSGKEEDLVGMMSISNGVVNISIEGDRRVFNVIKHPLMKPKRIDVSLTPRPLKQIRPINIDYVKQNVRLTFGAPGIVLRKEVGDFVNIAWRDLFLWSGMLWDPKRFPRIMHDWIKFHYDARNWGDKDILSFLPWQKRLAFKLFMPKSFSKVKDMKKVATRFLKNQEVMFRVGKSEYLENISKSDEHYYRVYENYECWGFGNVGAPLALVRLAMNGASLSAIENEGKDWNIVETKCIGLGDPYCEHKMVPGEIDELKASLEKDASVIEEINDRLLNNILGFLIHGKPLMERPTLGSFIHIHELQRITRAPLALEKLKLIFRMGGAKAGKMLGERLIDSGLKEQEAVKDILRFIDHCKAGKIALDETLRISENCERFGHKTKEPSCYFTTGFLNGFFYVVKNQHVRETKCIAMEDPYCEWEFR
jgi:predicted hydrocarbon binding protein/archaellum biogenesis ATPase FlaH